MVKLRRFIVPLGLLVVLALVSVGSWLLTTRSGALWLLARAGTQAGITLTLDDLSGSILDGLALQGLSVVWPEGRLSADQLQWDWQPMALLQKRLQIKHITGDVLEVQYTPSSKAPTGADSNLIPDITPLLTVFGGWSLDLQKVQLKSLRLSDSDGQITQLKQLGGNLQGNATQLSLNKLAIDGDWGRWRGSLRLTAADPQLSGHLTWIPPNPLGPLETLEAQLQLTRSADGHLHGPVIFQTHADNSPDYRLAGDLQLDLVGLELRALHFDRGDTTAGLAQGLLRLGWQSNFSWQTDLEVIDLNLNPELGRQTKISGKLQLQGVQSRYAGYIDLQNSASGWERVGLSGELEGDAERLGFTQLRGQVLGGAVAGELDINWRDGIASAFKLQATDLHLQQIPAAPEGLVDLQFEGWLKNTVESGLQLGGAARITKAVVLKRDFSGEIRADWQGGRQLRIDTLDLSGAWGHLKAQGDLQKHLALNLELLDASALWPPVEGQGELSGWLTWTADWPQGELNGQLQKLAYENWRIGRVQINAKQLGVEALADLHLIFTDLQQDEVRLDGVDLQLQGLPRAHQVQLQVKQGVLLASLDAQGGWLQNTWQGQVSALELKAPELESFSLTKPFALSFNPDEANCSEILLQGERGGRLSLKVGWNRLDDVRQAEGSWDQINLSALNPWLEGIAFNGTSQGQGSFKQSKTTGISLDLLADYGGELTYSGQKFQLDKLQIGGHWNPQGLSLNAEVLERAGGKLTLQVQSSEDVGVSFPQRGELQLELKELPLALFNAKLPAGQELAGILAASINGQWLNDGQFVMTGNVGVEQGALSYQDDQSRLNIPFEQTELSFDWQRQELVARASLRLGEGDGLTGDLTMQLPAQWPLSPLELAPISGKLQFHLGKLGAFSFLFPEQLADFSGELGGALRLAGNLQQPAFTGDLQLMDGRLALSQLGVSLEQIGVKAVFAAQQLKIEQIELKSGEGHLKGQGEVLFRGWNPQKFNIELEGDNALIANLPELRAMASPAVQITGDTSGWKLGGRLKIPELQIVNWHPPGRITRSDDVVYVDQLPKPETQKSLQFQLDLEVELGDKVVVKDRGLDVRLTGKLQLNKDKLSGVSARGQIDIPAGHFSTSGVKLPITSGRLYFNGGPVDNPALDILAMKQIGDVSAGVAVGGTVRNPVIRLVSDPTLDDTDILSYIVLGRPTLGGSGDFNALSLAAGALLSAGDSVSLHQRLQDRSGIDVIDVNTLSAGGVESAAVTVGKYLTPELYLSYGRSLTSNISQLQLRYSPSPRIDIESQLGEVGSADIYYKIEFTGD